jgi:CelD/BcsL family acetyltransferase involved in cellulose biosynthesis
LNIQFVRDYDEITQLAKDWEELRLSCGASVLNSHAILCSCLRNLPPGADTHILKMEQGGETKIIAPFAIFRYRASGLTIRALSLAGDGRGMLGMYHSTPLVRDVPSNILPNMMDAVKKLPWNTLRFTYLEPTRFTAQMLDSFGKMSHSEPVTELPCAYIDLAKVDKHRLIDHKFGRRLNRMMEELEDNGRLVQRIMDSPEGAEKSIRVYIEQHKRRWKKKGSSIFENEHIASFLADLARTVTRNGNGWINEILIDGEVAGQQMIIYEGRTAYAYRIGINESFARYSPGHIVTACSVDVLKAKGYEILDLGPGEEWFKRRQGGTYQSLLNASARRGGLNVLANISNLPVVKGVMGRLGIRTRLIKSIERW